MATTNYVGNFGVGVPRHTHPRAVQGVFGQNTKVRFPDIKDGTTNCIMVGERRMGRNCGNWPAPTSPDAQGQHLGASGAYCSWWAGMAEDGSAPASMNNVPGILGTTMEGDATFWAAGNTPNNLSGAMPFNKNNPGERPYALNKDAAGAKLSGQNNKADEVTAGFSSHHTGGAHILLGDGSVRFINESIDLGTYINLSRRSDGVPLGAF